MSENVQRQHPENNRMHIYAYNLRISIWLSDHDFVVKIHPFLALLLGKKNYQINWAGVGPHPI